MPLPFGLPAPLSSLQHCHLVVSAAGCGVFQKSSETMLLATELSVSGFLFFYSN